MGGKTDIEWTDRTWNPVRGCSIVSPGCVNCYAMKQAHRFSGPGQPYAGLTKLTKAGPQWTGEVRLVPDALREPLSWRKPARVFVNSMSDLFHEDVPDGFILQVLDVVERCPQHTFQVLTKRPRRMLDLMGGASGAGLTAPALKNLWLGVSAENQAAADDRIPLLLRTPAAVRFVSAEPLLGSINLGHWLRYAGSPGHCYNIDGEWWHTPGDPRCGSCLPRIDWVIVGGESGPGARPCNIASVRAIVRQCRGLGTPVFVKQLGAKVLEDFPRQAEDPASVPGWTRARRNATDGAAVWYRYLEMRDRKGGDPGEWAEDLRVREFPR